MSGNKAAEGVSSSAHNQRNLLNIYYENQQVRQLLLVNPIIKRLWHHHSFSISAAWYNTDLFLHLHVFQH